MGIVYWAISSQLVKSRFTHRWVQVPGYMKLKQEQTMCAFQASKSTAPFPGRVALCDYAVLLCVCSSRLVEQRGLSVRIRKHKASYCSLS